MYLTLPTMGSAVTDSCNSHRLPWVVAITDIAVTVTPTMCHRCNRHRCNSHRLPWVVAVTVTPTMCHRCNRHRCNSHRPCVIAVTDISVTVTPTMCHRCNRHRCNSHRLRRVVTVTATDDHVSFLQTSRSAATILTPSNSARVES